MKSTITILLLHAASLVTALSRGDLSHADAEALCGALGVMEVPAGVDPFAVRACKEHPTFNDAGALERRACWQGRAVGCSRTGWCYKRCDANWSGPWCWTTVGGPLDAWKRCSGNGDCSSKDSCAGGECKDCGCGC